MLCISVQVSGGSKSTHAMTRRSQLKWNNKRIKELKE
jgi:hypothetical protein